MSSFVSGYTTTSGIASGSYEAITGASASLTAAPVSAITSDYAVSAPAYSAVLEAPASASAVLEAPITSTVLEAPRLLTAAAPAAAALPLDQYQLNVDPNPEVIRKKPAEKVQYTQQISLKFFKPPPPQQPGDIVIKQERDVQAAPAPPLLVRQQPPAPLGN